MLIGRGAVAALCAAASMASAGQAHAVIPQGNTLLNGDGETGSAVGDETSQLCPQGWACSPPRLTLIRYGTTIFPSAAESARIGGGNNLFAGGPDNAASSASQLVNLGDQPEFDTGSVKATFGGCLGGFQDNADLARLELRFFTQDDPDGGILFTLDGPGHTARADKTMLLPVARTIAVPPTTQSFRLTLSFINESGGYNSGYADNLSVAFGPVTGPDPVASVCSVPGESPGGGPDPAPGPGGGPGGGGRGELKLLGVGTAVVGADGKARVRVTCNTKQLRRCAGTLSTSLVRASASAPKQKRRPTGKAKFSVASMKTRTITIALRPADAQAIRTLSRRALAKRRLKLRATTKVGITKLTQTSVLPLRRRG